MENIEIRPANIIDTELIVNLGRQTQMETFGKDNLPEKMEAYLNENFNFEVIKSELLDIDSNYFITEKNGEAIGYLKLRKNNYTENRIAGKNAIELQRIYVIATEKGHGIGGIVLAFCENFAKNEGYSIIWLGVWEKNEIAIKFYKKHGFEFFAKHNFDMGGEIQTDFMMKKFLK